MYLSSTFVLIHEGINVSICGTSQDMMRVCPNYGGVEMHLHFIKKGGEYTFTETDVVK